MEFRFLHYSFVKLSRSTRMTILVVSHIHSYIFLSIHWFYSGSQYPDSVQERRTLTWHWRSPTNVLHMECSELNSEHNKVKY